MLKILRLMKTEEIMCKFIHECCHKILPGAMYCLTTVMAWKRRESQTKSTVFLANPLYSELIDSSDSSFCSDGWTSRTSCWPRTSYWRRSTSPCVEDKALKFESGQNLWNRARPERFNTYTSCFKDRGGAQSSY